MVSLLIPGGEMSRTLKPHLSFDEQVERLRSKGLIVSDPDGAAHTLSRVNYYHLRGYYIDLMIKGEDRFQAGVTFEQVLGRFYTDDNLRQTLIPYLRDVEFSARVACSYALSHRYGAMGYTNPDFFVSAHRHREFMVKVREEIARSKELFVSSHRRNYGGKYPIWVAIELLSFGTVSKLYANMLPSDQKTAARMLGYTYDALKKLLHTLLVLRNLTAHHARLYARRVNPQYPLLADDRHFLGERAPRFTLHSNSMFAAVLGLSRLLPVGERTRLATDIQSVVAGNPDYRLIRLGFPPCWEELLEREPKL